MTHFLILQHTDFSSCCLKHTARFVSLPDRPSGSVIRIPFTSGGKLPDEVIAEWEAQQIDYAVLPERRFDSFGLIVSDMDSTLITIECIDEIAAAAGLKKQVAEITERAMQGELDFSQSLTQRVALLKGLPEKALEDVYRNTLQLSDGAEYLVRQCRQNGIRFVLVSGGFTFFTKRLQQRLGLDFTYANCLETENGVLTGRVKGRIIDAQAKAEILAKHREDLGLHAGQVLAVGDGANDISMLQAAGVGIAYRAKPKTREYADACIRYGGLDRLRGWFV